MSASFLRRALAQLKSIVSTMLTFLSWQRKRALSSPVIPRLRVQDSSPSLLGLRGTSSHMGYWPGLFLSSNFNSPAQLPCKTAEMEDITTRDLLSMWPMTCDMVDEMAEIEGMMPEWTPGTSCSFQGENSAK